MPELASDHLEGGSNAAPSGGNLLKRFQELCYWVREELPVKEAILDGEVVALDEEGRQNFRALTSGRGNLHYAAFDALWIDGKVVGYWMAIRWASVFAEVARKLRGMVAARAA